MLNYIDKPVVLMSGLMVGTIFGFLLQLSNVTRFNKIIGQLLLKDFTMLKVMISALISGSIALYLAQYLGYINEIPMPHSSTIAVIVGGLILGVGLSITGYCPGTAFAALGSGTKDAIFVILGLISGAGIYAELHDKIQTVIFKNAPANILTLPQTFNVSPLYFIIIFNIILLSILLYIKNK